MNTITELPIEIRNKLEQVPFLLDLLNFDGVYLAGGALRTLVSSTEEFSAENTDIDVFFRSPMQLQIIQSYLETETNYKKVYQCPGGKLATLVYKNQESPAWKVQLITVDFYDSLDEVIDSFDFTCICLATDGNWLVMNENSIQDVADKRLRWNKVTYPASSLRRLMKYSRKGYHMREEDLQDFVERVWSHDVNIVDEKLVYVD